MLQKDLVNLNRIIVNMSYKVKLIEMPILMQNPAYHPHDTFFIVVRIDGALDTTSPAGPCRSTNQSRTMFIAIRPSVIFQA
jgi:hypothetical protein